jgi:hypothetical protein
LRPGPWLPFERDTIVAYVVVTMLALIFVPFRRIRLWGLLLIAVVSGLSAQRHLRMSPILMAPMAAAILDAIVTRVRPRIGHLPDRRWSIGLAASVGVGVFMMWIGSFSEAFELHDRSSMSIGNALWVIRANGLHGRIWNDFNWGGAVLWALPESQVACDGRNVTAYSSDTLRRNMLLGDERDPLATVEQSGAELVLLSTNDPSLKALRSKYAQIFCDNVVCLLSSRPEFVALAKAGLRVPKSPVPATAFFALPGRPFLELKPEAAGSAARE